MQNGIKNFINKKKDVITLKKIKVLRIIGECKTGGVETIALNYYKNIDHRKIQMDFLFYGDITNEFREPLEKNGDNAISVTDYQKNLFKSILDIRNVVKKGNYDIVHSQLNALNFFPLLGAWFGGAKIRIASNHSTANLKYEFKKSIIKYILRPTTGLLANYYTSCSKYAGIWAFGKRNFKKGKIKIIRNAIDLTKFSFDERVRTRKRKELNIDDNTFVVGHVGRFVKQKNHKFIIEIFNELLKKNKNSVLLLIGDGSLQNDIKNYATKLGIVENIKFLGIRYDVNELMQAMDVFLFPSIYEGLGNVITESQAVALHSLSSTAVPHEVKMTEYAEFLSLNDSAKTWANKLLIYNKKYKRRNTHNDLIEQGYEIKTAAANLLEYYESLVV